MYVDCCFSLVLIDFISNVRRTPVSVAILARVVARKKKKDTMTLLRELISNAAQALDAVQFLSWYNASLLGEHAALDPSLNIEVLHDPALKTLSVLDTSIGMAKTELITKFVKEAEL